MRVPSSPLDVGQANAGRQPTPLADIEAAGPMPVVGGSGGIFVPFKSPFFLYWDLY
jgi:hypothetical protein